CTLPIRRRGCVWWTSCRSTSGVRAPIRPLARCWLTSERDWNGSPACASPCRACSKSKRRLYSYQKEGVARFLAEGRLVLADDMGLGKTTQAIVAASALLETGLAERGLLIVPASLKPQWEREWQAVSRSPLRLVDGNAEERRALYASTRRGFLVTNYEQVVRDFDAIAAWNPDLVILDEAQRIKNWSPRTALPVKRLRPAYRLVLTGTPMENRLDELA